MYPDPPAMDVTAQGCTEVLGMNDGILGGCRRNCVTERRRHWATRRNRQDGGS